MGTERELSDEYQHDMVQMIFRNLCVPMLWMKVASALEGFNQLEDELKSELMVTKSLVNVLMARNEKN